MPHLRPLKESCAVFVAERSVGEQILHRDQAFGFEHLGAGRPNAFHVFERGGSVQLRGAGLQVPVYNGTQEAHEQ